MVQYLIGIDEVGRGCLAGPVMVAAVALPTGLKITNRELGTKLKDSKKLSAAQREKWFIHLKNNPRIFYAVARVYPSTIDRINISQAANLAATRAFQKVYAMLDVESVKNVLLDGGLYLKQLNSKSYIPNSRTIIKGDEKYNCVKLASIVAKVKRDHIMKENHEIYPKYGFDKHKGYGTKQHDQAIRKYGLCFLHRLTFCKKYPSLKPKVE